MDKRKPTLLLGMMNDAGLAKIVADCLRFHGFEVVDFSIDSLHFKYPNLWSRLKVKWQQLLGNKEAKKELMVALKQKELANHYSKNQPFDYALFIRSDVYPLRFLQTVKQQTRMMVNYQWDGVARFASSQSHIPLFDRFYAFDPQDLVHYPQILPTTSFYFDHFRLPEKSDSNAIYFVGAHRDDRLAAIIGFCEYAKKQGWTLNFQIAYDGNDDAEKHYPVDNIQFHHGITYQQNLENAQRAGVLADFVISTHQGLSLRTFEAIGYRKKLITTNQEVAKYDFYHPDNIYIWDGKTFDGMNEFLAKPYHELPAEIYEQYSFGNWIRYILDIPPYHVLRLPEK